MSDHQPEGHYESMGQAPPAEDDGAATAEPAADPLEPDFSRLRMARASLDAAFPER
jgi:hypothetical protein